MTHNKKIGSAIYHICILIIAFSMLYPVLWMIASSLKTHSEIFKQASSLIPGQLKFDNYIEGWKGFGGVTFTTFFKNSFIITISSTIGQVFTSALVAYGFARLNFYGKKFWFTVMLATMMLPGQVLMIPQYLLFNWLGWVNSFKALIIPSFLAAPFFVFLIRQFIQGIPRELDEAALIDGCSKISIFFRIIIPNIKPALITASIFRFYWSWNDFFGPLLYIQSSRLYPVSLALKLFSDPNSITDWGAMFAMSVLSLIPVFLIFIFFQKYLVEGISTTGVKG